MQKNRTVIESKIRVVFEDDEIVVVDKPAGLVVNRAETVKSMTLQDWFVDNYPESIEEALRLGEQGRVFVDRAGLVHRLDKETSGVMVMAKTTVSLLELMSQFKERKIEKVYWALVHGRLKPEKGSLSVPLGRIGRDRKKFGVVVGGKMTETNYQVKEEFGSENVRYQDGFSLVELYPKTGRTHQLRVVLKHLGYAIVSDSKYVGRKRLKEDLKWCERLFLHAKVLRLTHPVNGKKMEFSSPLSSDLDAALGVLKG